VAWREENDVDAVAVQKFPDEYNASLPYEEIGLDKFGRPGMVFYEEILKHPGF